MIDGVIFDMDGILFDTEKLINECFAEVGVEYRIDNMDYIIESCVGLTTSETKKFCKKILGEDFPVEEMFGKIRNHMEIKLAEGGMPVKPGVYLMLEYLKANRYVIALASSSSRKSVMHHIEEANMTEYFSVIIAGDEVERGKPEPDIYLKALEKMNLRKDAVIAFEDSPNGLKSATAAGIKAIMIPDQIPYSEDLESYVFERFNSMTDALEALKKGEIKI